MSEEAFGKNQDSIGERFRAAREARRLSLSEVAEQIRIRSVYLAAIEEENWGSIGVPVYVRGFLRTYARFIGLDPEEAVGAFNATLPASNEGPPGAPRSAKPSAGGGEGGPAWRGSIAVWVTAAIAALLIAFVVYNELTLRRVGPTSMMAMASAGPTDAASPLASPSSSTMPANATPGNPSPSASPAAGGPNSIALILSAPSWLRVTVDGNVSMEGTFPAGTSKTFHGKNALVRIGNAGGVEVYVDGKNVGKLGGSGDVVEHAFTL